MPLSDFYIGKEFQDFYKILGVSKDANIDDIKKAYKKGALEFHPDKNPQSGAAEIFKKIGRAYEVLSNPDLKKEYDQEYYLVLEEKLAQAQYFSGGSQPNHQSTQQPQDQSNQWQSYYQSNQRHSGDQANQRQSGDQSNQRQSGDQGARWQDHYKAHQKTFDKYGYEIRKINNYIDNLRKDQRELLKLQRQTRTQLDIANHQNDWAMVVNYLKQLRYLQQQEQNTALKILSSQQDLVALKTEAYTMGQTFFSGNEFTSFFEDGFAECKKQLESLQTQADNIKQKIELQHQINANNNQEIQVKIDHAKIIEKMQTSVIAIENKIAMVAQQKNITIQTKRKNMQDRMQAQRTARLHWNQGDVSKAIIAERNGMQLFIDENQQLLNQVTAELREAELQQAKVKYLGEIVKNKNLLFPNKALQHEHENKKILEKMWERKIKQYNNKIVTQQMEYNASVAMKDKIALIEDLQKTRIFIKKSQEQLLMNPNFLGANQSSLRNKSFQEYQRLSQWLEHKYLNKNFWNKPYDEIKDALEEIKDAANNIHKQVAASKPEVTKPQVVNKPGFTKAQPASKPVAPKPQSANKPVVTATNKPAVTKSQSTINPGAFKPQPASKPMSSKSNLGFSGSAVKVTKMPNKVQTPKEQPTKMQTTEMQTPKVQPTKMQQHAKPQSTTKPVAPKPQSATKPVVPTVKKPEVAKPQPATKPVASKSNLGFSNSAAKIAAATKATLDKLRSNQDPQKKSKWR